ALADEVKKVIAPWQIRQSQNEELKKKNKILLPFCRARLPLWDYISEVLKELDQQPGRRVLLAITDGGDDGSKTLWKDVMFHAQIHSETVFGLMPTINPPSLDDPEDKLKEICVN